MESKTAARQSPCLVQVSGESAAIYAFMGLFAVLLALVTSQHEMYVNEAQAWLIARDSGNLLELVPPFALRRSPSPVVPADLSAGASLRKPGMDAGIELCPVSCNGLAGYLRAANSAADAGHVGL